MAGAVFIDSGSDVTIKHSTLVWNGANKGGGIYRDHHRPDRTTNIDIYNSLFSNERGGDCRGNVRNSVGNFIKDASCGADYFGDPVCGHGGNRFVRPCLSARWSAARAGRSTTGMPITA